MLHGRARGQGTLFPPHVANVVGRFQSAMLFVEQGSLGGQPASAACGSQSCTSLLLDRQVGAQAETSTLFERCTQQTYDPHSAVLVHPSSASCCPALGAGHCVAQDVDTARPPSFVTLVYTQHASPIPHVV